MKIVRKKASAILAQSRFSSCKDIWLSMPKVTEFTSGHPTEKGLPSDHDDHGNHQFKPVRSCNDPEQTERLASLQSWLYPEERARSLLTFAAI